MCAEIEESIESILQRFHRSIYTHFERSTSDSWITTNLQEPKPVRALSRNRRQISRKIGCKRKSNETLIQVASKLQSIILKHKLCNRRRRTNQYVLKSLTTQLHSEQPVD